MIVMWRTKRSGCESTVLYAADDAVDFSNTTAVQLFMRKSEKGKEGRVEADEMCAAPANRFDYDPLFFHTVVLDGLERGRRYWYCPSMSKHCFQLSTPRAAGASGDFSFIMYADMGESDHFRAKSPGAMDIADAVAGEVLHNGAELVLHVGDVSYADGDPDVWSAFFDAIQPYASVAPYMVAIGNHDYDYKGDKSKDPSDADPFRPDWGNYKRDSGGECGVALVSRFSMLHPTGAEPQGYENAPFWYSFNYGKVHFTVVSSEHVLLKHSEQWEWLKDDLKAVNRCETPWVVLGIHRPLYVIKPHHSNVRVGKHFRANLEDLLFKYGVDVVMSGHVHSFSRTCAVFDGDCVGHENGGAVHVIAGSGGHKLSRIKRRQFQWLDYAERKFGYARVTVSELDGGDSEMTISYVRGEDSHARDSITITSDLTRRGTCSYCYSRTDGRAPLGVPATCDSSDDLDALFDLRFPAGLNDTDWLRAEMPVELYLQTAGEVEDDSSEVSDDDNADVVDADPDSEFVDRYVRANGTAAAAGEGTAAAAAVGESAPAELPVLLQARDRLRRANTLRGH